MNTDQKVEPHETATVTTSTESGGVNLTVMAHPGGYVVFDISRPTKGLTLSPGEAEGLATQLKLMAQKARRSVKRRAP